MLRVEAQARRRPRQARALVKELAGLVRRAIDVQRDRAVRGRRVGHAVQPDRVVDVAAVVGTHHRMLLRRHGVPGHHLAGRRVPRLDQLALEHLDEAVALRVAVDRARLPYPSEENEEREKKEGIKEEKKKVKN